MVKKKIVAIFGNVAHFGQERANIQVFSILQNAGHELILAVNDLGFHWHLKSEIESRNLSYRKIRFTWNFSKTFNLKALKGYMVNIPKSNYQLYKLLKNENPDVIHVCNDLHVLSLLPVLLWTNKKVIYRLGDRPTSYLSQVHKFIWKQFIIPRVDHFVCISKFISNDLIALGCNSEKITLIYNYAPKRQINPEAALPERLDGVISFAFIGQLTKEKGIDLLVKAFLEVCKTYPTCRLLIAGDVKHNKNMVEYLINLAAQSEYGSQIQLLGKVNNVDELLKNSDVNIIPSVYEEPLSNVIVEAKSNGIASIVFPSGGLPELVEHKINGYITSHKNVESLVEAISYYIINKDQIQQQGKMAFESLHQYGIDYDSFITKWLEVYG